MVCLSFHLLLFDNFSFLYFLTLLKVNFIYLLAVPGLCCGAQALLCSAQAFSSCREWPLSSCGVQASHCSGFSLVVEQGLEGTQASVVGGSQAL